MDPDRLSRELANKLEAARMTAEALALDAQLARDTVGRWLRGTTIPTLAALRAVEDVLSDRLGCPVDLAAAVRERRSARQRDRRSGKPVHGKSAAQWDPVDLGVHRTGHARRGEIAVYLRTLIDWLNTDPWPRDPQFGGPVLTPAAIERKLRITAKGQDREQDLGADGLAQQCMRLVVLGGPGSGKTWLARRTARRCAEYALEDLAAGGIIDEIELPLYTTCSRLFGAGGDIREAAVSSALGQLGDLGGSRISAALQVFFAERNAPTLLVIDSLDEAHGPSERLHQAGTLPWRIVLTSRPSSWRNQLTINDTDESHRVGKLRPLRYPGDVEPFIERWFAGRPERGNDLAAQIARRPGIQQAATVPLVLAFYCIVGGTGPLPDFRRDLYTRVLNRMLTGRWRGDDDRQPDADTCLQTLRAWAWDGAANNHPVSGVGMWADDIPTERIRLGEADADALDHVATPLGPPDVDTGKIFRRFVHRSIREHLVAEYVASLPVDQAVKALLPHLWCDPDWEYAAPAALAMHPQRDQLLRDLICRVASSDEIPGDLSIIEWESPGLLARIAAESSEADWSPEVAGVIGRAQVELARSGRLLAIIPGRFGDVGGAAHWGTSDRQTRGTLLALLARQTDGWLAGQLAGAVARIDPTAEDKRQARGALLALLARETDSRGAAQLARGLAWLDPTAEDKRQARGALLALLARETDGVQAEELVGAVAQLATTAEDKRQARGALLALLVRQTDSRGAAQLARGLAQLDPTAEDKRQARGALLGVLARQTDGELAEELVGAVARLDPTAEDKRQARGALLALLARQTKSWVAVQLAGELAQLDPTAEGKRQARGALLGVLARQTDSWGAAQLADGLAWLDPTAEDKRQARGVLLALLARETDGVQAEELVGAVAQLARTAEEKRQARGALLALLVRQTDGELAAQLADGVARLARTAEDKRQARAALLGVLARQTDGWWAGQLAVAVARIDPTAEEKRQARGALLALLARETDSWGVVQLAGGLARLDPTAEDKRRASGALLGVLARQTDSQGAAQLAGAVAEQLAGELAEQLVGAVARLARTAEEKRQARGALLALLVRQTDGELAAQLADGVARLARTAEDKRQARGALLGVLARQTDSQGAAQLAGGLARLDPTAEDKRQASGALLGVLARETDSHVAVKLARAVARLATTAEDKRQARGALVGVLARGTDSWGAVELAGDLAQLDPTVHDLRTWRAWTVRPAAELLAAVRRNSALTNWLAALPSLTSFSGPPS